MVKSYAYSKGCHPIRNLLCTVLLAFLLLGLAGVVGQDLVEKGAAGGLLEEIDDRVVHRVAVLVQPSKYGLINGTQSISVAITPELLHSHHLQ